MYGGKLRVYFLLALLLGVTVLVAFIFAPFLKPLGLAAVFAVVLGGVQVKVAKLFNNKHPSISALLTLCVGVFVILIPLSLIGTLVANQAHDLYISLSSGSAQNFATEFFGRTEEAFGDVVPGLSEFTQNLSANLDHYTKEALKWVIQNAGSAFSTVSSLLAAFLMFVIALYYLLRDGARVRRTIIDLSPLNDREDEQVLRRLENAVSSVIKGNLLVALSQGLLAMLGFTIFGVPNAVLWGMVAAVAALIPGIGTALVFVPIVAFLYLTGAIVPAIGVFIWGVLAVGLIDNLLGPRLVGKGMMLHPLLVLVSVLGGLLFFGPTGIVFGPLSLSLLFALLSIYVEESRTKQ